MVQVSVAVLTYRRNDDLRALLPMLLDEIAAAERELESRIGAEILVVDNDPDAGASEVMATFVERFPVRYLVEPRPGIAAARNRALDAGPATGLVAFIDDDERPVAGWLTALVTTWERHRSAAVGGPVQAHFVGEIDPWVRASGYFDREFRKHFRTGVAVDAAPTGNIMFDMAAINSLGLRFDATLGLAGGEDTLFTRQLVAAGGEIIWCNEAVVLDPVPPDRLTRRWVVRRVFFVTNARIHATLKLAGSPLSAAKIRGRYALAGVTRIILGAARAVTGSLIASQRLQSRGVSMAARGAGALTAVLGVRAEEYRR